MRAIERTFSSVNIERRILISPDRKKRASGKRSFQFLGSPIPSASLSVAFFRYSTRRSTIPFNPMDQGKSAVGSGGAS